MKPVVARGWTEERFLSRHCVQLDSIVFDKPFLLHAFAFTDVDLQLLGETPRRFLRILSTGFIFLPTLSLALATGRAPS